VDWSARVRRVRGGAFVQLHNVTQHANWLGYDGGGTCAPQAAAAGCTGVVDFAEGLPLVPMVGLRLAF
jgi:hypothetical protein